MKSRGLKKETKAGGRKTSLLLIPLAAVIVGLAVWGPEELARYRDREILNQIQMQETDTGMEGYRYALSSNEKLYILSQCLDNQVMPESDRNAMTRVDMGYQELGGNYAFVVNRKDASGKEVSKSDGIRICNEAVEELKELKILPDEVKALTNNSYNAILYSAIDVLEPRNNVLVWKISLSTAKQNANKENRLLDAYVDADTGKMYEFYARTGHTRWSQVDADSIVRAWAEYMGLGEPEECENTNPLSETTPYFKKYSFAGTEENSTIVTIGFYEGINEIYLKVSR